MSEKEIKKLAEQLKKDFKKSRGGLGGLDYSTQPMKYDEMFKEQARNMLKGGWTSPRPPKKKKI